MKSGLIAGGDTKFREKANDLCFLLDGEDLFCLQGDADLQGDSDKSLKLIVFSYCFCSHSESKYPQDILLLLLLLRCAFDGFLVH